MLVALAFGLLGLGDLEATADRSAKFSSRSLDWRLFALGVRHLPDRAGADLRPLVLAWSGRLGLPFRLRDAIRLGFIGNVFNLVIPGAVGGDLIKAAFLGPGCRINKTQAIASMVIDRILGLLGLFLLAGIAGAPGLVAGRRRGPAPDRRRLGSRCCSGSSALAAIFGQALTRRYPATPRRTRPAREDPHRASKPMSDRLPQAARGGRSGRLAMSMFIHALNVIAFYIVSRTIFPNDLPSLASHFLMVPLVLFTTAVPLPFGALGLSEEVSEQLFKLVAHPAGALAMMGFRVLMYGGGVVSVVGLPGEHRGQASGACGASRRRPSPHAEEDLRDGAPGAEPRVKFGNFVPSRFGSF